MQRIQSGEEASCSLELLPQPVLEAVYGHLTVLDAASLMCTSRCIRATVRGMFARCTSLPAFGRAVSRAAAARLADLFPNLCSLELGHYATDAVLLGLSTSPPPRLERLAIAESATSDTGVLAVLNTVDSLQTVDAAYCIGVTNNAATFAAQRGKTVYRLPDWFAKRWVCKRHSLIPTGEIHEYKLDGTFVFSREMQAEGYVVSFMKAVHGDHCELYVEYSDDPGIWPDGERWRPGVCIQQMTEGAMRTAQRVGGVWHCPDALPEEDAPGVCTGLWRAADAPPE